MGETERGGKTMTDDKIIDLFFERSEQAIPALAAPFSCPGRPLRAAHRAVSPVKFYKPFISDLSSAVEKWRKHGILFSILCVFAGRERF